ncbi:MAG TPA: hypothetical protein PLJ34_06150 [Hyphomicrobiales bacterium]|nr:hypothetical protein [Kaistiaceae bacterium]HQF31012.1 hypothetical protein [Hyphomicrobiales bacterium]
MARMLDIAIEARLQAWQSRPVHHAPAVAVARAKTTSAKATTTA